MTVCSSRLRPEPISPATPTISPAFTSRSTGPRPSAVRPRTDKVVARSTDDGGVRSARASSLPTISRIIRSSVASAGVRSATSLPLRSTITRSATARTSSSRWPMNSTAPPAAACSRASSRTRSASTGPSEDVGSSRMRTTGRWPHALAISIICRTGTGKRSTGRSTSTPVTPTSASRARASARVPRRSKTIRPNRPSPAAAGRRPSSRFSATLEPAHQRELLRHQGHAQLTGVVGAAGLQAAGPAISMVPVVGVTVPDSTPISVDLPAPFSPTTATICPRARSRPGMSSTFTGPYDLLTSRSDTACPGRAGGLGGSADVHQPMPRAVSLAW